MFRKALYYPYIDVQNENWLKTAALYWDEISTIVPGSIKNPYLSDSAKIMCEARLLKPYIIHSKCREVREIVPEVMDYLNTDEALRVLMYSQGRSRIHMDKFSDRLMNEFGGVHPDKVHDKVRERLLEFFSNVGRDGTWLRTPDAFAHYYMTLLADKISRLKGLAVISDFSLYDQLSLKIRSARSNSPILKQCPSCGWGFDFRDRSHIQRFGECPRCNIDLFGRNITEGFTPYVGSIVDGILAQIVLKGVAIRSDVRMDRIIEFRIKHKREFNRFRGQIQKLTNEINGISEIENLEVLYERLSSVYVNEIKPQISLIDRKLNESGISTVLENFKISGIVSIIGFVSSTIDSSPLVSPYALFSGAGISVIAELYMYNRRRREIYEDPYSYVLSVKNELGY